MEQLLLMTVMTFAGTIGVFIFGPFLGVAVYYLFAVLRPEHLWDWALPGNVRWSYLVAITTIIAALLAPLGHRRAADAHGTDARTARMSSAHAVVLAFGMWVVITYGFARNRDVSYPYLIEYLKLLVMFTTAAIVIRTVRQLWVLMLVATGTVGYIAYEVNALYLFQGRLDIFHTGYGGLDNNGAGLMLAMGVPLCVFAWEGTRRWWRWPFLALIPLLIHAVLVSYSRGAMIALLAAGPLIFLRSRQRRAMSIGAIVLALMLPIMAGREIRARFFSVTDQNADASVQSRFDSWRAGLNIAIDHPFFGVGVRNANLLSHAYGADREGRTIHSQYLQIAADNGFVGLALYLTALIAVSWHMARARRAIMGQADTEACQIRAVAAGVQCALAVFWVGAAFLSIELFELPYLLLLLGAQLPVLPAAVPATAVAQRWEHA